METRYDHRRPRKRSRAGIYFARSLELIAIALAYLEKSRLVRFVTAKLSMSAVVEVTARFGRDAGHRLSTFLSLIVAEPRLLAVIITGILLIVNLVIWLTGLLQSQSRRSRHRRAEMTRMAPAPEPKAASGPGPLSGLIFILCLAVVSALLFYLT